MTETQVRPPKRQVERGAEERGTQPDRSGYVTVIRPASRWPRVDLRELWRYRELLGIFVWRDLKVRYKQTLIGAGWAIFQPVLTVVVYTLVFGRYGHFPSAHLPYPLFVLAGVLVFQYFATAMNVSSMSLVSNVPLVTKVYFPRLLLPMGAMLVPLVDFALTFLILIGTMAWYRTWPSVGVVVAPLFVMLALVTALGIGLVLSALNVRYRDVPYVLPVFMQVLPFLSGVPWDVSQAPPKWQWLLSLNPMTSAVSGWRWALLGAPRPVLGQLAVSVGVAVLLFVIGLAFFKRSEPRFADTI